MHITEGAFITLLYTCFSSFGDARPFRLFSINSYFNNFIPIFLNIFSNQFVVTIFILFLEKNV